MGLWGSQIQVPSCQFNTRPVIDAVGCGGAAAIPIGNFGQSNVQGSADAAYGFGIISCRSLQRTARIIGFLSSTINPPLENRASIVVIDSLKTE
jgi:hypothetical protein